MSERMRALRWPGGKSANEGCGDWIAAQLPYRYIYCEPFCGMAGVLLKRKASPGEILNDLDERVYNWWCQLRDAPDALLRAVRLTPVSRRAHEWAEEALTDDDPLLRAVAFTVWAHQSLTPGAGWALQYAQPGHTSQRDRRTMCDRLRRIATRIHNVQLECCDALSLIGRMKSRRNAVIYCDPPYRSSKGSDLYAVESPDWDAMSELVSECEGVVAISGLGDEWDHLDWPTRLERPVYQGATGLSQEWRTEVLWVNRPASELGSPTLFTPRQ